MDRRHRAILTVGAAVMWAALGGAKIAAQAPPAQNQISPAPPSPPAASATPWVQAAPPAPTLRATPKPAVATPTPAPKPTAARTPTPTPAASGTDEIKAKMQRERGRELSQSQTFEPPTLPRDEQTTFRNNARIWNKLLPEEKQEILSRAEERIRGETEQAYVQSGLSLNDDQHEVFALRYRQERRRLERELQEKANNERNRRMPQILEQLKREFGKASAANPPNSPPKPVSPPQPAAPSPSPSATVNGTATPSPSVSKAVSTNL